MKIKKAHFKTKIAFVKHGTGRIEQDITLKGVSRLNYRINFIMRTKVNGYIRFYVESMRNEGNFTFYDNMTFYISNKLNN